MKAAINVAGVALCALLAGAASVADEGTVYLWVDPDGTPHYQDRPPDGAPAKELSLRYRLSDPAALQAAAQRKSELADAATVREDQQAEEAASEQAARAEVKRQREANCKQARERLEKYETAHRLYKPSADGERQYLTDEETDAARAEARRTVDEWCSD
jgi:hypothetical protein